MAEHDLTRYHMSKGILMACMTLEHSPGDSLMQESGLNFHMKTHKSPLFNTEIGMSTALFNL